MTYKELKNKIKQEQKDLALKIRELKSKRKESNYGYVEGLIWEKEDYRHIHIMYCNFFNKTPYDKIENPREDNGPCPVRLSKIKEGWESLLDEALRDCA
jgi:hypothetical protein